jgi:hypothetical protein
MILAAALILAQLATPAPKLKGGFGQPKPTVTRARVVISDEGVPRPVSLPGQPVTAGALAVPLADDEARWRGRYASLRADVAAAVADLARAEMTNPPIMAGRGGYMYEVGASTRNAALSPYRMRVMQLRAELDGLPEECRRTAGCQPGWVR